MSRAAELLALVSWLCSGGCFPTGLRWPVTPCSPAPRCLSLTFSHHLHCFSFPLHSLPPCKVLISVPFLTGTGRQLPAPLLCPSRARRPWAAPSTARLHPGPDPSLSSCQQCPPRGRVLPGLPIPPAAAPSSDLVYFPGSVLQHLNVSSHPDHRRRREPGRGTQHLQRAAPGPGVWRSQPKPWAQRGILPKSQQMQMTLWR